LQAARLSRRFFATYFRRNALTYENQKKVKVVESMFQRKQANFLFIYLILFKCEFYYFYFFALFI